jgi:C_GCAxxG_C_C family probable redox protein
MDSEHPDDAPFVAKVRRLAMEAFDAGAYCGEAVAGALAKVQCADAEAIARAATAFCSGMSRTGGNCGALTGAIMGLSLALGRDNERASPAAAFAATAQLVHCFETEFGARNCHSLLGCDMRTSEGQARFLERQLYSRCERYTARAAELAAILLARHKR